MNQYYSNYKYKSKLKKYQYKKHPKWEKRKLVRIILFLLSVIFALSCYFSMKGDNLIENIMINFLAMWVIGLTPWISYLKILQWTCSDYDNFRISDFIIIEDDVLKYVHHPQKVNDSNICEEIEVRYDNIGKIVYNTLHERIDIYSPLRRLWYSDYIKRKCEKDKAISKPNTKLRLYLYYDKNEEILRILEEKSNLTLEIRHYPEE